MLKNYTFTWKQLGIFKLGLLASGITVGAYWQSFFSQYVGITLFLGVASLLYITYITFKK